MTRRSTLIAIGIGILIIISVMLGAERATGKWLPFVDEVHVANAADTLDVPPTTHAVFTKMLKEIGINNPNGEITSDSIFHTSNKNIYLYTYQQTLDKAEKAALLELGQSYGLTPAEAEQVISGIYTPLVKKANVTGYGQDRAVADMTKIQRSYARILQHKRLEYQLGATVASTEIFANGSVDDSSFDLIHDLDIIEQILFVEQSKNQLNQKPFKDPTSKTSSFGTSSVGTPSPTPSKNPANTPKTDPKDTQDPTKPKAPADTGKPATIEDIIKGLNSKNGTINACEKNSPINKAIDSYDTTHPNPTSSSDAGSGPVPPGGSSGFPTPDLTSTPVGDIVSPEFQPITVSPATPPVTIPQSDFCSDISNTQSSITSTTPTKDTTFKSESKLIYSYPEKAPHIFCISLDTRSREYKSYYPKDTCIQCMVAAMNDTMKKLLSKSLTPNKITGNAFESSKCKSINLSSLVDINIFTIPVPILTPNKLGPFVGHDIGKEWDRYVKNGLPFGQTKGASIQRTIDEAAQNAGPDATQSEVLNEITSIIASQMTTAAEKMSQSPTTTQADAKSEGFQQIVQEMRIMTSYFAGFQEVFKHFNNDTCKVFTDKKDTE